MFDRMQLNLHPLNAPPASKMILMAARGKDNDEIAARLHTRREVVSQSRKRFFKERMAGLQEHARPGRPRGFFPQNSRLRSRRSPVNCRPPWVCRCRDSVWPMWHDARSARGWSRVSAIALFGVAHAQVHR